MSGRTRTPNFPEIVQVRTERGLSIAIADAARRQRTSAGEYKRRALRAQLIADGVELPPIDGLVAASVSRQAA